MNDDKIRDLKQYISATLRQEVSAVIELLDKVVSRFDRVDARLDNVESKIDDLSASVAEAIEVTSENTDIQIKDHEQRILKLEKKAA